MATTSKYDFYYNQIACSRLEAHESSATVRAFLLKQRPNSMMMSTWIFDTPAGIILAGDLVPADRCVIAPGYDLRWFAGNSDPSYLASKFLKTKWVPEYAVKNWKEMLEEYRLELADWKASFPEGEAPAPDNKLFQPAYWTIWGDSIGSPKCTVIEALENLLQRDECFETGEMLYDSLPQRDNRCPWDASDLGGTGYAPEEVGWLVAIQRRFAECYAALPDGEK